MQTKGEWQDAQRVRPWVEETVEIIYGSHMIRTLATFGIDGSYYVQDKEMGVSKVVYGVNKWRRINGGR